MAKKTFWTGMLAMVLAFGMAVVGCDDSTGTDTDDPLNGTWGDQNGFETTFNNGNYEVSINGVPNVKGTYTINGNKYTYQVTHRPGSAYGLSSQWYTKEQLNQATGMSLESLNGSFSSGTYTFTVSGNTLTMILENGTSFIQTRK